MKALNGHHATVQLAEKLASITKWEFISKRFFPVLRKETAHRFYFLKLGFFSELISTWAAEWTVSRGLSILTDLQKQTQGSTPSAIRRPPLPTTYLPKTPLLRNNARARDVHLTKAAPATSNRQCERVTSDGLTVGLLPNWLSVKERRAIRSPLKYVSHQTMLFWENLFHPDNRLGLPKTHTSEQEI